MLPRPAALLLSPAPPALCFLFFSLAASTSRSTVARRDTLHSSDYVIRAAGRPRGESWRSEQRSEVHIVWRDALAFLFPVPVPSPFPHRFLRYPVYYTSLWIFKYVLTLTSQDTIHLDLLARAVLAYHSSLQAQCPFYDWVRRRRVGLRAVAVADGDGTRPTSDEISFQDGRVRDG
ncbi:hypothetical protein B0H14DRAFT_2638206 [Mycena olivaceomarginata]|nr:hypothetical protein B0H14DRAFT_2638206 [Mycena olivaceomarginata]